MPSEMAHGFSVPDEAAMSICNPTYQCASLAASSITRGKTHIRTGGLDLIKLFLLGKCQPVAMLAEADVPV